MIFTHDISEETLKDIQSFIQPLQIEIDLEGQKITDENNEIVIGCRAGPDQSLENVLHEFGHFIEIDDKRMNKPGWGLKYGKWVNSPCPNRYCSGWYELTTDKHIQREIRVWAFQANLLKHFKLTIDFLDLAGAAPYLPDFYLYKNGKTDEERIINVAKQIEEMASTVEYSFEKIISEMNRKRTKLLLRMRNK